MTNIRTRGFESPSQIREHLAEIDEAATPADERRDETADLAAIRREIAWLRVRVEELRIEVERLHRPARPPRPARGQAWLRIAGNALVTAALGQIFRRLGLAAIGAATIPLIVAELDRRIS